MHRPVSIVAALLLAVLTATTVMAHHSFAHFDQTKRITLTGTVKEFQFTNPHSWIYMEVSEAGAKPDGQPGEWAIEALSPNVLSRNGWKKNTLKPGDEIKVLINPARDGSRLGNLIQVTLPDGRTLGGGAG